MPPPPAGPARDFMTALFVSHYMYVVGALQVAGGALLLTGRWIPLGLTLFGPVIVNILCVHVFLEPSGLPLAMIVSALALFLLWRYRARFAGIVQHPTRYFGCPAWSGGNRQRQLLISHVKLTALGDELAGLSSIPLFRNAMLRRRFPTVFRDLHAAKGWPT